MARRRLFAVFLLLFVDAAPANVFLPDGRTVMLHPASPWSRIGKVIAVGKANYCSGALVASSRVVWTAAHCVWDFEKQQPKAADLAFQPADSREAIPVRRYSLGTQDKRRIYLANDDWAVLILLRPATDVDYFPLPQAMSVFAGDYEVMTGAYSTDRADGKLLAVQPTCRVQGVLAHRGMVMHDCDGWHGSSGAPLFTPGGGDYQIRFLNTSQRGNTHVRTRYSPTYANVAIPVTPALVEATRRILREIGEPR